MEENKVEQSVIRRGRVYTLIVLLFLGWTYWAYEGLLKARWDIPYTLILYPYNGDNSPEVDRFLNSLRAKDFVNLNTYLTQQAANFGIDLKPALQVQLADVSEVLPPLAYTESEYKLAKLLGSLSLRFWAYRHIDYYGLGGPSIQLLVKYYKTPPNTESLDYGLEKSHLGVVELGIPLVNKNSNEVLLMQTMLHALGAPYHNTASGYPSFPAGFADASQAPLYPQYQAEIMSGRLPLNETQSLPALSLGECVIGDKTAASLQWKH